MEEEDWEKVLQLIQEHPELVDVSWQTVTSTAELQVKWNCALARLRICAREMGILPPVRRRTRSTKRARIYARKKARREWGRWKRMAEEPEDWHPSTSVWASGRIWARVPGRTTVSLVTYEEKQ